MGRVVVDKFLKGLVAQLKAQARRDAKRPDSEAERIRNEIANLYVEKDTDFPALNIEPLKLFIRQGASIGHIEQTDGFITIEVKWPGRKKPGIAYQDLSDPSGEIVVDNGGENDAVTVRATTEGRRTAYTVEGANHSVEHVYERGKRVYSENLGTGNRSYYYEGTDRVAFVENPNGQIVKQYYFDDNKKFEVELQPTKFERPQRRRRLIADPKLRLRKRLHAYKKKIKARVRKTRVSGEFEGSTEICKSEKTGQVLVAAGAVLVANAGPSVSVQGMFGLSEGLVAAFLRSASPYTSSVVHVSKKPTSVAGATDAVEVVDDSVALRGVKYVQLIVMSEGALLVMPRAVADSFNDVRDDRSVQRGDRGSKKSVMQRKAAIVHASYNEASKVGAPIMAARGGMPTLRGERYIAPSRSAHLFDLKMNSSSGKQSSLFRNSVLSATPGYQYVVPAALPVVNSVARVDAKTSVKEAMRQELVKKTDRGSRDSGGGSNSHARDERDDKPKQQEEKDLLA